MCIRDSYNRKGEPQWIRTVIKTVIQKMQKEMQRETVTEQSLPRNIVSVSYTHLDVYKRQQYRKS